MKRIALLLIPACLLLSFKPRIPSFKKLVQWVKAHPGEVPEMDVATLNRLTGLDPYLYIPNRKLPNPTSNVQANSVTGIHYIHDDLLLIISDSMVIKGENTFLSIPIWTISSSGKRIDTLTGAGSSGNSVSGIKMEWGFTYYPVRPYPVIQITRRASKWNTPPGPGKIIDFSEWVDTVLFYQINPSGKFIPFQTNERILKRRLARVKKPTPEKLPVLSPRKREKRLRRMINKARKPKRLEASLLRGRSLFIKKCSFCHAYDTRRVGPPLKGILTKYEGEEAWLYDWISDAPGMIAKGDARAVALWNENYKQAMTSFSYMSDPYITDILIFLDQN